MVLYVTAFVTCPECVRVPHRSQLRRLQRSAKQEHVFAGGRLLLCKGRSYTSYCACALAKTTAGDAGRAWDLNSSKKAGCIPGCCPEAGGSAGYD